MDDLYEHDHQLRALAMRVAALEDNIAFLEEWCEEQQDILDRSVGPAAAYDYEIESDSAAGSRAVLRVVDLRDDALTDDGAGDDDADSDVVIAVIETDHDRKVRLIRARLGWLRARLEAASAVGSAALRVERRR
jgi:hypothetical protein